MKNENIKIPFGIYEGQIIHISSAVSGREYECCECGSELIPVISNKIASHFRHKSKCKCDGGVSRVGGESPIHKYAKKIILEEKKVYIDEDNFIEFREVKEEYKINGTERIVDLYCVTNDYREIAIEIFYKHKVESDKVQELKDNKVRNVLEINIPDITNFKNDAEIRAGIIKNFTRDMLINTDFTEANYLRKELLDKFEIDMYKKAQKIRNRLEEEKEYHKAFIKEKYLKQEEKRLAYKEEELEDEWIKLRKRLSEVMERESEVKRWDFDILEKVNEISELNQEISKLKQEISKKNQEIQSQRKLIKDYNSECDLLRHQKVELKWQIEKMKA